MNELSMTDQETILGLLRLGWSARRVARQTGHRRETVARYGIAAGVIAPKPAMAAEVATDSPPRSEPEIQPKPAKVATDSAVPSDPEVVEDSARSQRDAPATTSRSRSSCEAHRAFIDAEVAKGRNAVAIYQDLIEHHGYAGAYNAVKRFVGKSRTHSPKISCRFETLAAQEAQVDYGEGAPTRDPRTEKFRKPRLFVMTLGFSRHAFRKVVWKSSSQAWCELHEEAFAYFGGVPATVRLDNLREGVIDPDIYDPNLNALYAAMLKHYRVVALPCRPYAPDLKGKVESAVGHTQGTALKGRTFSTLEDQNAHLLRWNERWAATRIHGTTKRQVREMFIDERSMLGTLPLSRFEYYRILERRVHLDGHVEVDGAYYSAPGRYVGTSVVVHAGRLWLRILDANSRELVREHEITKRGSRRTAEADRPKQTPPKIEHLVEKIAHHGPACGAFARAAVDEHGAVAARMLFGVLDLLRRYGPQSVEHACLVAAQAKSLRYRFLRTYLQYHEKMQPLIDRHENVAEIETYSKHLNTLMKGQSS
jgi:transposase